MAKYATDDTIEFAGDYFLPNVVLHNHEGEGLTPDKKGHDIKAIMQELNIYESIYKSGITGSVVINDATNIVGNLPIQGTETLSFRLSTPNDTTPLGIINATQETGQPFHIYKLADKQQLSEGMQFFVLHFASREFMRNTRVRVSQALEGGIHNMVQEIVANPDYLDSRKFLYFQQTRNQDKFVIPNLRPFSAIDFLCSKAMPSNSKSAGYLFYETTKGFHFRSFESLLYTSAGVKRTAKQTFKYMPANVSDEDRGDNAQFSNDFTQVESYKFLNNVHDTALNSLMGTYGHRIITHNLYNKSYDIADYHYHNYLDDILHADGKNRPQVVSTPVDYDNNSVSDYAEARVSVDSTSAYLHDTDLPGKASTTGIDEATRISVQNQITNGTRLQLVVKGQSYLQAGDVINFELREVSDKNPQGEVDKQFGGRYVISKIRHRVTSEEYKMVLECVKDSVLERYAEQNLQTYPNPAVRQTSYFQDVNSYDNIEADINSGKPLRL